LNIATEVEVRTGPRASSDSEIDVSSLIEIDRVHASLFLDEEIFQLEMEKIFKRGWVYVGHESEVPLPGSFQRKRLGLVEVLLTRDQDGDVHVIQNACPHRGAVVCKPRSGEARALKCSYHGWTFRNDGSNIGIPLPDAYTDQPRCGSSMPRLPRVESYRGLVFASFEETGISLEAHLGDAAPFIDRYIDRSPSGSIAVTGEQRSQVHCNWKFATDNTTDGYHARFVHRGVFWNHYPTVGQTSAESANDFDGGSKIINLGNGHQVVDWGPARATSGAGKIDLPAELATSYEQALHDGLGPERAASVLNEPVPHLFIFPNLFLIQNDLRVFTPLSPSEMSYDTYFWAMEGVDPEINRLRHKQHQRFYSPSSGFVLSDDLAQYEQLQIGLTGGATSWLDQSRGMHREKLNPKTGNIEGVTTDEVGTRGMWQHYKEVMT